MIYEEALRIKTSKVHLPPCTEIEKLIYNYDEFNWLVDDWAVNDTNKEQRAFEILIEFNDGTYTEISQVQINETFDQFKFQFAECTFGITKTMQAALQFHHSSNVKNDIKMQQKMPVKKLNTSSFIRFPKEGKFEITPIEWKR